MKTCEVKQYIVSNPSTHCHKVIIENTLCIVPKGIYVTNVHNWIILPLRIQLQSNWQNSWKRWFCCEI